MTNLWHDIPSGDASEMTVIIEIPRGSHNKYEIDKETGLIKLDRVLHSAQTFPFDYGFIPQTLWDDGDALDVMLLATSPLYPGVLVHARPVALMNVTDGGDKDDKIIAVPIDDPRWEHAHDLPDLNSHTIKEIEHFYSTYKKLQNKEVEVHGFSGMKEAQGAFKRGKKLYQEKFSK